MKPIYILMGGGVVLLIFMLVMLVILAKIDITYIFVGGVGIFFWIICARLFELLGENES